MATDHQDIDDFINSGGSRAPAFKFVNAGDSVVGTVTSRSKVNVPVIGKPGEVEEQLLIQLKTDKEYTCMGKDKAGAPVTLTGDSWSVYVRPNSQMLTALAQSLRDGGAPKGGPHPGDRLAVEFVGTEPSKTQGFAPKKVYRILYKHVAQEALASAAASSGAVSVDDL